MSHHRDGGFRWRGAEISRIEGLSDAVFAFAVALLIVALLHVDHLSASLRPTTEGPAYGEICHTP